MLRSAFPSHRSHHNSVKSFDASEYDTPLGSARSSATVASVLVVWSSKGIAYCTKSRMIGFPVNAESGPIIVRRYIESWLDSVKDKPSPFCQRAGEAIPVQGPNQYPITLRQAKIPLDTRIEPPISARTPLCLSLQWTTVDKSMIIRLCHTQSLAKLCCPLAARTCGTSDGNW